MSHTQVFPCGNNTDTCSRTPAGAAYFLILPAQTKGGIGLGGGGRYYSAGIRIPSVSLLGHSGIVSATLKLKYHSSGGESNTVAGSVRGEKVLNPAAWSTDANFASRMGNLTTAVNSFSLATYMTLQWDVKNIVQELVNQAGWSSGNALAFFIFTSTCSGNTLFDQGIASNLNKLTIEWEDPIYPIFGGFHPTIARVPNTQCIRCG